MLLEEDDLLIEIIENGTSEQINITQEKQLPNDKFQDFFCCENILALVYPRECVFYNWKQREVLLVEKVCDFSSSVLWKGKKVLKTYWDNNIVHVHIHMQYSQSMP